MAQFLTVFNPNISSEQILSVLDTINNGGGQILSTWGNSALIGEGSPDIVDAVLNSDGVAYATSEAIPDPLPLDLEETGLDMGGAWMMGQSAFLQQFVDDFVNGDIPASQALPPGGCDPDDNSGGSLPVNLVNLPSFLGISAGFGAVPARVLPDRHALVGTVGVSILQIDGPAGSAAAFTTSDWSIALISLARAFDFLQNLAPAQAHLVFTTQLNKVRISNVDPASIPIPANPAKPTPIDYENCEAAWRDPALQALGMGSGFQGYQTLLNNSQFLFNADWKFVFVLTKYRAAWPGVGAPLRVAISYSMEESMGFLGILPLVFAHEIGHTTATADEYQPNCSAFQKTGFSNSMNANCENGNFNPEHCLMRDLSQMICFSTQSHFGWGDQDSDGIIDPFDPDFVLFP
jgi:hypothetical protein